MTRAIRAQIGYGLSAALISFAIVRSGIIERPPRFQFVSTTKGREIYAEITSHESEDRLTGTKKFRYSHWSAEDDFFAQQAKRVREYLKKQHESPTQVLDVLDEGMHEHWPAGGDEPPPVPTVIPCRPRLSY